MTGEVSICKTCHKRIVKVNFALGEKWMHQDAGAAFEDGQYMFCHLSVAEPVKGGLLDEAPLGPDNSRSMKERYAAANPPITIHKRQRLERNDL